MPEEMGGYNLDYINIALAKGRLGEKGYNLFKSIGLECDELEGNSRKLVFTNTKNKTRYMFVKASDVPIYVERGAADIGIVGKDTLLEEDKDLFEIADLDIGKCQLAVASFPQTILNDSVRPLRIATKYPNVAKKYFLGKGIEIDIIKLNGSVELAPLIGLADAIVDIVETGTTLKENGLLILEPICSVSARLVANKVSFKMKNKRITEIMRNLKRG